MGAVQSCLQGFRGLHWLTSNPLINLPEENTEDQPKIYSWDIKKTDLSEYMFENLTGQEVYKSPGTIQAHWTKMRK